MAPWIGVGRLADRAAVEADRAVHGPRGHREHEADGHGRRGQGHRRGQPASAAAVEPEVDGGHRTGQVAGRPEPAGQRRCRSPRGSGWATARPAGTTGHTRAPPGCRSPPTAAGRRNTTMAGVSISDVVPTSAAAARPGPIRPVSRATSRPAISITATRIAVRRHRQDLRQPLEVPRAGDQAPGHQPPGRHDVRVVRHQQVGDRAIPGPRGRHVGHVVAEELVELPRVPLDMAAPLGAYVAGSKKRTAGAVTIQSHSRASPAGRPGVPGHPGLRSSRSARSSRSR